MSSVEADSSAAGLAPRVLHVDRHLARTAGGGALDIHLQAAKATAIQYDRCPARAGGTGRGAGLAETQIALIRVNDVPEQFERGPAWQREDVADLDSRSVVGSGCCR